MRRICHCSHRFRWGILTAGRVKRSEMPPKRKSSWTTPKKSGPSYRSCGPPAQLERFMLALSSTLVSRILFLSPATASGADNYRGSGYCSHEALFMGSCIAAYSRYSAKRAYGDYKSCTNTSAGRYWCTAIFTCDSGRCWPSDRSDLP